MARMSTRSKCVSIVSCACRYKKVVIQYVIYWVINRSPIRNALYIGIYQVIKHNINRKIM